KTAQKRKQKTENRCLLVSIRRIFKRFLKPLKAFLRITENWTREDTDFRFSVSVSALFFRKCDHNSMRQKRNGKRTAFSVSAFGFCFCAMCARGLNVKIRKIEKSGFLNSLNIFKYFL